MEVREDNIDLIVVVLRSLQHKSQDCLRCSRILCEDGDSPIVLQVMNQ